VSAAVAAVALMVLGLGGCGSQPAWLIASMNDLAPGRGIGELTDHPCREARNVLKAGRLTPELETGAR
jgi:hypothetical protein